MPAVLRLLCLAALCLTLACCSDGDDTAGSCRLPPDGTVLAIGDSITRGYGAAGRGYVEQLQELLRASPDNATVKVVNEGVDGERSAGLLRRIGDALDRYSPSVVLITTGGNDLLRKANEDQVKSNIVAIIERVRGAGAYPVLFAVPRPSIAAAAGFTSDHALFRETAETTGAGLIADVVSDVLSREDLRSDEIHPNAQGYALMAQAALNTLSACTAP